MTIIRINAITVPEEGGDELARRFGARAGAVDGADGFEGFELMRPTDERRQWLVVTRWRDEDAFNAWVSSPAFAHGHRSVAEGAEGDPSGEGHGHEGHGHGQGGHGHGHGSGPVSVASELWSYEVIQTGGPKAG